MNIGFGTYQLEHDNAIEMIKYAFSNGIYHIDTAYRYKTEEAVGIAIKETENLDREKLFITSKIWISDIIRGKQRIIHAIKRSIERMQLNYIDLILLHMPAEESETNINAWNVLEDIVLNNIDDLKNKVKYIGVSNYKEDHLKDILNCCRIKPYVNQIEVSPFCTRKSLILFCKNNDIKIVAHSSLTKGTKIDDPNLLKISDKNNVTVPQLLLKWSLKHDLGIIPRTSNRKHFDENYKLNFDINDEDMEKLNMLNENYAVHKQYL